MTNKSRNENKIKIAREIIINIKIKIIIKL